MPPKLRSRYLTCTGLLDKSGRRFLSTRGRIRFVEHPQNRVHVVAAGDTLWSLAGRYFGPTPRACGLWWLLADFQPEPILDPTLGLEVGTELVVPAEALVREMI